VKAKRRAGTAKAPRTPTIRRIKPAITPVSRRPGPPGSPGARPRPAIEVAAPAAATVPGAAAPGTSFDPLGGRPVSLAVDLGRGLVLGTPILAASGAVGYGVEVADLVDLARLGGIVTRGTTLHPRGGRPSPRTAAVPSGLLNGIGLQNPGIEAVLERYADLWARWPVPVIVNVCGESTGELAELVRRLEGVPGVGGVEVNLSCANGARGQPFGVDADAASSAVAAVRRTTDLPVIAKLTAAAPDVRAVARAVEDAGADAVAAINTLPGLAIAGDRRGPALGGVAGGISGPALKPIALRVVWEVAQAVDVPVVGIGGVATIDDVLDLLAAGAAAVGVGVAALADPMLPVRLADELADACRARGLDDATGLVATALPAKPTPLARAAEYGR
jgi:dihydroorotate dehydrogenase (NAD+) catalytic subunit